MKSDYNKDQPKLEHLLIFIHEIRPPGKSKSSLAKCFGCSLRTIYRYVKTLEAANFDIEEDESGRIFICEPLEHHISMHLTTYEAIFLYELVNTAAAEHRLSPPILSKLLFYTELGSRVKHGFKKRLPQVIQDLSVAMKANRQILSHSTNQLSAGRYAAASYSRSTSPPTSTISSPTRKVISYV